MRPEEEEEPGVSGWTLRPSSHQPLSLAELALARVRNGSLPRDVPATLLAGTGENTPCTLCSEDIMTIDVDYELTSGVDGSARTLHLHIGCYHAWLEACRVHAAVDRSAGR